MKSLFLFLLLLPLLLFPQSNPVVEEIAASATEPLARYITSYGDTTIQTIYTWNTRQRAWEKQFLYKNKDEGALQFNSSERWDTLASPWVKMNLTQEEYDAGGCLKESQYSFGLEDNTWGLSFRQVYTPGPAGSCNPSAIVSYSPGPSGGLVSYARTLFLYDNQGRITESKYEESADGGISWIPGQLKTWIYTDSTEYLREEAYSQGVWVLYREDTKSFDGQNREIRSFTDFADSHFTDLLVTRDYDTGGDTARIAVTFSRTGTFPWEKSSREIARRREQGGAVYTYNYSASWDTSIQEWNYIYETEQNQNAQGELQDIRTYFRIFTLGFGWAVQQWGSLYAYEYYCDGLKKRSIVSDYFNPEAPPRIFSYGYLYGADCEEAPDALLLYPNPARGQLFVSSHLLNGGDARIEILDITGRIQLRTVPAYRTFATGIDVEGLVPGTYFLRISKGDTQATKKFVREP